MSFLFEMIGWYGTGAILIAYFLNSLGFIGSSSVLYQGLNITGAIAIICISYRKKVYQSVFLNVIWVGIGIVGLISIWFF